MNNVVIVSGRQQRDSAIQKHLSIQRAGFICIILICLLIEFRVIFSLTFSLKIHLLLFDALVFFFCQYIEGAPGIYVCPQFPFLGISRSCGEAVKNLPIMQETWVQSLNQEDSLKGEMPTHSSIPAREIPWTGKSGGLQPMGSQRVRHDSLTCMHTKSLNSGSQSQDPDPLSQSIYLLLLVVPLNNY